MPIKSWWEDKLRLVVAAAYTVLLTVISLMSMANVPAAKIEYADKLFHLGSYVILAFLWMVVVRSKLTSVVIALFIILYGIIIEFLQQQFTRDRSLDIYDIVANSIGVIIVLVIIVPLSRKLTKR